MSDNLRHSLAATFIGEGLCSPIQQQYIVVGLPPGSPPFPRTMFRAFVAPEAGPHHLAEAGIDARRPQTAPPAEELSEGEDVTLLERRSLRMPSGSDHDWRSFRVGSGGERDPKSDSNMGFSWFLYCWDHQASLDCMNLSANAHPHVQGGAHTNMYAN